jgi:diaminohydroxyphosphoribosylaminopyrimidine deaminase/5-amino-6-(5-phosphoribosylamino)uracil reductase
VRPVLEEGLADQVAVIVAPKIAGAAGVPLVAGRGPARMADALRLTDVQVERLGDDVLVAGVPAAEGRRAALAKNPGRG